MLFLSMPVRAEWLELTTRHFRVLIDTDRPEARLYVERLEQFDAALRRLYGVSETANEAGRHHLVTIFALRPELFGKTCGCDNVLGYYQAKPGGSVLFTLHEPRADAKAKPGQTSPQTVLLHEYSHHFMWENFPSAYPLWYREGFAEFNSNAEFKPDGAIVIGLPDNARADSIHWDLDYRVSLEGLLIGKGQLHQIYGRGWLLTHYLMLGPSRRAQFDTYLTAVAKGKDSLAAARDAFGDLRVLSRELDRYAEIGKLYAPWRVPPPGRPVDVRVRPLGPAEIASLPVHARAVSGVAPGMARYLAGDARRVAKSFPNDAGVLIMLAESEFAARNWDQAIAAADAAIAVDDKNIDALVWRGRAAVERARAAKAADPAVWKEARGWYLKANRLDPDAARPLLHYYESFLAAGVQPSAAAIKGLQRAAILSPEDDRTRTLIGERMLVEGQTDFARSLLAPVAFAPHAKDDNRARRIITLIDDGQIDAAKVLVANVETKDEK